MKIMQICFSPIISSAGGAEKVYCNMSNYFCNKHSVIDICCDGIEGKPFYKLDKSVELINLFNGKKLKVPFYVKVTNEVARVIKKNRY